MKLYSLSFFTTLIPNIIFILHFPEYFLHFAMCYQFRFTSAPDLLALLSGSMCACMLGSFSRVWLCVIPWTIACKLICPWDSTRVEYWSGLSCPPPRDLPHPVIKLKSVMSPALEGGFFF